jgi:hypothetical protein
MGYVQFFKNKESIKMLDEILYGRGRETAMREPPEFAKNILEVKEGIKELKNKYGIKTT